jgi:hypothetical protein
MSDLSDEEIKEIKQILDERRGAKLVWRWLIAFLSVAVPLATLYGLYKQAGGQP